MPKDDVKLYELLCLIENKNENACQLVVQEKRKRAKKKIKILTSQSQTPLTGELPRFVEEKHIHGQEVVQHVDVGFPG